MPGLPAGGRLRVCAGGTALALLQARDLLGDESGVEGFGPGGGLGIVFEARLSRLRLLIEGVRHAFEDRVLDRQHAGPPASDDLPALVRLADGVLLGRAEQNRSGEGPLLLP